MGNVVGLVGTVALASCVLAACGSRSALLSEGEGGGDAAGKSGSGGASGSGSGGAGGSAGGVDERPMKSSKLDLLLVVDNSRSMGEKQDVLRASAATLISRLTNPRCLGAQASDQPASKDESCPAGSFREMAPVTDMHIGVLTTSLGGHGADTCSPQFPEHDPSEDDRGELVTRGAVATYQNRGYLVWDPDQRASPPGNASASALTISLAALIGGVGEVGCGFESSLEAWYRFLIDPDPPESVVVQSGSAVLHGTNQELLLQRAQFLRPDSAVLIVILSDENDCSVVDGDFSWIAGQAERDPNGGQFFLPRATKACAADPNSPCCRSCNAIETTPPRGCQELNTDPGCQLTPHDELTDPLNLRCWEQKRRFGIDFLHPIARYVRGLTSPTVPNRSGTMVQNPLFADLTGGGARSRHPSLISVAGIVGVPWQDLAENPSDSTGLRYMSSGELGSSDRWSVIVGDPARERPPRDPFMRESVDPRTGVNPITGDGIEPPSAPTALASAINGHEWEPENRADLQYACIFPLLSPLECGSIAGCDCSTYDGPRNKPLCQAPDGSYGTTQYHAQAYPGLRQLDLLSQLGTSSIVASICPRNPGNSGREDYAYAPAVQAMVDRLKDVID